MSLWKAIQTQQWRNEVGPSRRELAAEYDYRALKHLVDELHRWDARWEDWFHATGREPIRVIYEEFVDYPGGDGRPACSTPSASTRPSPKAAGSDAAARPTTCHRTGCRVSATTTPTTSSRPEATGIEAPAIEDWGALRALPSVDVDVNIVWCQNAFLELTRRESRVDER